MILKKASKLFFDLQLTLTVDMTTYLVDYLPLKYGTCMKGSCIQETKVIASRSNIIAASNTIKVIVTKNGENRRKYIVYTVWPTKKKRLQ